MSFKASVFCAALSLATGLACGPAHADGASASPASVRQYLGTLSAAGEGRRVYLKLNCAGCHGDRAAGGMGPNIQQAEQGDINETVSGGGDNGMPAFGPYLNPPDLANLGAYLRSINTTSEPKFQRWWEPQPTQ